MFSALPNSSSSTAKRRSCFSPCSANMIERPLKNIVLSGGGAKVVGLAEFLSNELNLTAQVFDPFERIQVDERKFDRQYLSTLGPEIAIAAGLAIRPTTL